MNEKLSLQNEFVKFLRVKDYLLQRELGGGACGKTVLLYDDQIDKTFVCKKYHPYEESRRTLLYEGFTREVKLLFALNHPNVVRVYSYFLYPDQFAGYIIMEHVEGSEIDDYVWMFPEKLNDLFEQAVAGFSHLEECNILHRDIRTSNLMVGRNGDLKIIDLGFGKQIATSKDYEKSISLNWAASTPREFMSGIYDSRTEVYFVGKLFEEIIKKNGITSFRYTSVLSEMCRFEPEKRIANFKEVGKKLSGSQFDYCEFTDEAKETYRSFADSLQRMLSKIEMSASYVRDIEQIQTGLTIAYQNSQLEYEVSQTSSVLRALINGSYYSFPNRKMATSILKSFVRLLESSSPAERLIIVNNLHNRLDNVPRYDKADDEDIPF